MRMLILRGVPGSGKSTFAADYSSSSRCSADDYFMRDGKYEFQPSLLSDAHAYCFNRAVSLTRQARELVVIDNTNITCIEIAPYYLLGTSQHYDTEIITFLGDPDLCAARNIHEVSAAKVRKMAERMELEEQRFPSWWRHRVVEAGK